MSEKTKSETAEPVESSPQETEAEKKPAKADQSTKGEKQKYFLPRTGEVVDAASPEEAASLATIKEGE